VKAPFPSAGRDRVLLLLACAWLAATAWVRPLALPDEGRYIGVAWEMLRSGQWLVPTLDGLPYFHKPPLFYWLTATALSITDSSLIAARIAPLCGAWLATVSLFLFARHWAGRVTATGCLAAMATAPIIFLGAQYANLDMLVAGCITATVLAFAHAALLGEADPGWRPTVLVAYVACALGVLAKGLIGIVLPGMVLFLWLALERRWATMFKLLWWPGILVFFIVAAPWFVLMQQRFETFSHYFFIVQHFQRYSEGGFNNPRPAWFYAAVLVGAALPWSLWWFGSARREWRGDGEGTRARRLMLVWAVAITLFFSMPRSKLAGYILPAVPPLLYLAADAASVLRERSARWASAWRIGGAVAAVVCVAAVILAAHFADRAQHDIGRMLREQARPDDTVVALDEYRYGLIVEGRLRQPVVVSSDWSPRAVASRDNWRRELADAAVFQPAHNWLVENGQVAAVVCAAPATAWLVGHANMAGEFLWLKRAEKVLQRRELALWRLPAGSQVKRDLCRGKPSANSAPRS
jgi:4-amino-4-deoxy-L-arabinose transferase-like glycosyltransferase